MGSGFGGRRGLGLVIGCVDWCWRWGGVGVEGWCWRWGLGLDVELGLDLGLVLEVCVVLELKGGVGGGGSGWMWGWGWLWGWCWRCGWCWSWGYAGDGLVIEVVGVDGWRWRWGSGWRRGLNCDVGLVLGGVWGVGVGSGNEDGLVMEVERCWS